MKLKDAFLGRKVMTNLDSILKSRDITLPKKVRLVKAMVFPVVIYGCESRAVKRAEHRRIDAFDLWYWRRLLRVPWTAKRSNQSILKEISPGISLEGLMLKLKLQYFGHLMRRVDSLERAWCWEGLGAGGEGDDRGWDVWMAPPTQWTWVWVNSRSCWWTGRPGVLWFMGSQRVGHDWATELNWTLMGRSCWGFSFALRHRGSFVCVCGIQHSPVDGGSAARCNFGVLAGEDACTSFYSAILITLENTMNNMKRLPCKQMQKQQISWHW